jgi:hypothetical protein
VYFLRSNETSNAFSACKNTYWYFNDCNMRTGIKPMQNILIIKCITNSCIWNTGVTWQGIALQAQWGWHDSVETCSSVIPLLIPTWYTIFVDYIRLGFLTCFERHPLIFRRSVIQWCKLYMSAASGIVLLCRWLSCALAKQVHKTATCREGRYQWLHTYTIAKQVHKTATCREGRYQWLHTYTIYITDLLKMSGWR